VVDLVPGLEAEPKAWSMVQLGGEALTLPLGELLQVCGLGQVLAKEAVGVLVGPTFPSVMRGREVDAGIQLALDVFVATKL
jgi:hypothetical protein